VILPRLALQCSMKPVTDLTGDAFGTTITFVKVHIRVTGASAGASWSEAVRIADAVFRLLAEKAAAQVAFRSRMNSKTHGACSS
jgi:hypothetical protein